MLPPDGAAPKKTLLARANDWFRNTQENATDEERDTESRNECRDFSDDEVLGFLDRVMPHPEAWFLQLQRNVRMRMPRESWVRLCVSFALPPNEKKTIAIAHTISDVEVVEDGDSGAVVGAKTRASMPAAIDARLGWLLSADLESLECDDATIKSTAWIFLLMEGYSKPVTARYYANPSGAGKYWAPMPDLLEPHSGWDYPRYCIAPALAGDTSRAHFESLIETEGDGKKEGYVAVRRDLALAAMLVVCAPPDEEWAKDAVRRHDGRFVWIPREWYMRFCEQMGEWLKLRSAADYQFALNVVEPTPYARTFTAIVRASCAFVGERAPVINGTVL